MDLQKFAAMLTDRQYNYPQFSTEEIKLAEENGFVIVYGISDDLVELDGAIYDEGIALKGGELYIPLTPDNSIEDIHTESKYIRKESRKNVAYDRGYRKSLVGIKLYETLRGR